MKKTGCKYIFVVGGVISGVGKGITVSSISKILQDKGLKVTAIKIDPYINVDAGTMNPTEHGEVFVLSDGYETDQDMGNYERFLNITLSRVNYMTTGSVYKKVIEKERNLEYKGKCVEVVPHIPLEVIDRIKKASRKARADVVVIEVGGTIGEYQNLLFLEAARMMKIKEPNNVAFVMVSYLPVPAKIGEMKTKPTQHAVRTLNGAGIQPDIIIARSELPIDQKRKEKISIFCNIASNRIISAPDIDSIYEVPINFEKEGLARIILKLFGMKNPKNHTEASRNWNKFVRNIQNPEGEIKIAVVGKYFSTGDFILSDSYLSIIEALKYSAYSLKQKPVLDWLSSDDFEKSSSKLKDLEKYDGILIPGGFGSRGIEGKLRVIKYAREHQIPFFGLCYGMQLAVIEFARNVLKLRQANTREVDPNAKHLIIDVMEEQKNKLENKDYGGTMRLGSYPAILKENTIACFAYGKKKILERHRHRYEVNPEYIDRLTSKGLIFSGISPDRKLMEIMELPKEVHPFFLGTQFHPEFQARPLVPHPLFTTFIKATIKRQKSKNIKDGP